MIILEFDTPHEGIWILMVQIDGWVADSVCSKHFVHSAYLKKNEFECTEGGHPNVLPRLPCALSQLCAFVTVVSPKIFDFIIPVG